MGRCWWKLEFAIQLQDGGKHAAGGKVANDAYASHNNDTLDIEEEIIGVELDESSTPIISFCLSLSWI
ncbi:hypothetical protein TSUD_198480 [Trifolium subterraneum]|uniref:Uncharacterized protein n=1 Tax=Trifolium subterraneum TaxID=3900 RepID=A0A2Z6P743_TRISU|nr:hypothetical protein TSUD_198480 [Trifolium subterraneum]